MKILVVDDHALVREGLRQVLKGLDEAVLVLEAATCQDAFWLADRHADLDLLLLDHQLPDMRGIDALDSFGERHPELPVVMLSGSIDPQLEFRALTAGAAGYVNKGGGSAEMLRVLRAVLAGESPVRADGAAADNLSGLRIAPPAGEPPPLTRRQQQVLGLLMDGHSNKDISRVLAISEETTRDHVSAILRCFGVQSRTQAVLAAGRLGYGRSRSSPS